MKEKNEFDAAYWKERYKATEALLDESRKRLEEFVLAGYKNRLSQANDSLAQGIIYKWLEEENAALRERVRNADDVVVNAALDEHIRKEIWNEGYAEGRLVEDKLRRELEKA